MNRQIKLLKLAKLNRLILFGNYNKVSLIFLKQLRDKLENNIKRS